MENRFDELAKLLAGAHSRREALRRLGGGMAVALLAVLGTGRAEAHGGFLTCSQRCKEVGGDPRNPASWKHYLACLASCSDCQWGGVRSAARQRRGAWSVARARTPAVAPAAVPPARAARVGSVCHSARRSGSALEGTCSGPNETCV